MLSSMLKKIEKEEEAIVHGYKRKQVTSHDRRDADKAEINLSRSRTPGGPGQVRFSFAATMETNITGDIPKDSPFYYASYSRSSSNSILSKEKLYKGPRTAGNKNLHQYRRSKTGRYISAYEYVPAQEAPTRPSYKLMTPAYTPSYRAAPSLAKHRTAMTPAYTPSYAGGGTQTATHSPTRIYNESRMKTVIYTPKYDPMHFDGLNGNVASDEHSFVASPTTPRYTPTSPAFLEFAPPADDSKRLGLPVREWEGTCTDTKGD